jgi:hypothetical protein
VRTEGRHIKKSVTIEPDVLAALSPERLANLSATVNDGLRYMAALDEQRQMVAEWEAEGGPFTPEDLAPYLEAGIRAQALHMARIAQSEPAELALLDE